MNWFRRKRVKAPQFVAEFDGSDVQKLRDQGYDVTGAVWGQDLEGYPALVSVSFRFEITKDGCSGPARPIEEAVAELNAAKRVRYAAL